jgi:hypothetical protein
MSQSKGMLGLKVIMVSISLFEFQIVKPTID